MKFPWGVCNLCRWPIVKISSTFSGTRCLRCFSTQIHRAVGIVIDSLHVVRDIKAYELSSRGALFKFMKRNYPSLYFSEYFDGVPPGEMKHGIPCQDVQHLLLADEKFDLVTSTEVFEHVPNDIQGFQEIFRILKKGGRLVFTVPITENRDTIERAIRKPNGSVEHLLEPEYHTDRIRGKQRVLAYRIYGKDLVKRLESAGFAAEMRTVVSHENRINGVIVTIAKKMASGEYPD